MKRQEVLNVLKRQLRDKLNVAGDYPAEDELLDYVLADRWASVKEALLRAEEGLYGICADCGKNIALRRLKARPEAIRCMQCQSCKDQQRAKHEMRIRLAYA